MDPLEEILKDFRQTLTRKSSMDARLTVVFEELTHRLEQLKLRELDNANSTELRQSVFLENGGVMVNSVPVSPGNSAEKSDFLSLPVGSSLGSTKAGENDVVPFDSKLDLDHDDSPRAPTSLGKVDFDLRSSARESEQTQSRSATRSNFSLQKVLPRANSTLNKGIHLASTTARVLHGLKGARQTTTEFTDDPEAPSSGSIRSKRTKAEKVRRKVTKFLKPSSSGHRIKLINSKAFTVVSALVIVANTVYLGIQIESTVKQAFQQIKQPVEKHDWLPWNITFAVLFSIEIVLRLYASGLSQFLCGRDQMWNCFDSIIVAFSVFEVLFEVLSDGENTEMGLGALRAIRLIKIFRILRVAKVVPVVRHLQTMLFSLYGSLTSFLPAIFLLVSTMYIYSLSFMQGVEKYLDSLSVADLAQPNVQQSVERLEKHFGSLSKSVYTLFSAVSGGDDWENYAESLSVAGTGYQLLLVVYVASVLFGLLNIVSGVFVNVAMQSSQMAKEIAVDLALSKKETLVKDIVDAFNEADRDKSGTLSWEEFMEYLTCEKVQAHFHSLDIDSACAEKIFRLIDHDQSGQVSLEEFVLGCLNYRGGAKNVDVSELRARSKAMMRHLDEIDLKLAKIEDPSREGPSRSMKSASSQSQSGFKQYSRDLTVSEEV